MTAVLLALCTIRNRVGRSYHDDVRQIAHQISKLLIGQPGNLHALGHIVEILETRAALFKLHPYVWDDGIGQPPEREEPCIMGAASRNLPVITLAVFDLEELPSCPGVAVPDQHFQHIAFRHGTIASLVQNLIGRAWSFQRIRIFLCKLFWQRIEQRQSGNIIILGDFDDLSGQHHDESLRGFCHCFTSCFR